MPTYAQHQPAGPALLECWVAVLTARRHQAPDSLRFFTVDGASSPPALIAAARAQNIPFLEGCGLSEYCAIVAMSHPNQNRVGTVCPVLDGLGVTLENEKFAVLAPAVMQGYLNGDPGHFEGDYLVIDGRVDALLVIGTGRDISPDRVGNGSTPIRSSALGLRDSDGQLVLVVAAATQDRVGRVLAPSGEPAGLYPPHLALPDQPSKRGLLFPSGTANRATSRCLIKARDPPRLPVKPERLVS